MTREDIEQLNILVPYCFETDLEEKWYNIGLKHGLEIADKHPNLEHIWHNAGEEPVCASSASSRFTLLQEWNTQVSTDLPDAMSKASASPRLAKR